MDSCDLLYTIAFDMEFGVRELAITYQSENGSEHSVEIARYNSQNCV